MGSMARLVLVVVRLMGANFALLGGSSSWCLPFWAGGLEGRALAGFPAGRVPF